MDEADARAAIHQTAQQVGLEKYHYFNLWVESLPSGQYKDQLLNRGDDSIRFKVMEIWCEGWKFCQEEIVRRSASLLQVATKKEG